MSAAYVDTSCLVAIAFSERDAGAISRRLSEFDELVSSSLLEAELRSAFAREGVDIPARMLSSIAWILPDRPLSDEITRVLGAGYLRGADCWHLASALYLAEDPSSITFLTMDVAQRKVAKSLGFKA